VAVWWVIVRVTRRIRAALEHWRKRRLGSLRVQQAEIVSSRHISRTIDYAVRAIRVVLVVAAVNVYLTYLLGLFPWTRPASVKLLDYALTPLRAAAVAFAKYLPNLLFVAVIGAIVYFAIRVVGIFFHQVRLGRIVFANFPPEWADPTNKIVRVLLVAFGVVVAFPYLPASDSPAFAGVSVFMGVLISLSSSSALSNMLAGIVLTYTGAFRIGDRVKVGDAFGDIVERSLLATHVRTIKNEDITIPNSIVLNSSVVNYSRVAASLGLILHSNVTIGYNVPWRRVHELLIEAALATPGVLADPAPFVWQTALNDFYVTYEINAYTRSPQDMIPLYADLHARIQDAFYAAGVEIMSPHYTSIRDGNTVAIPEALRGPGYSAPAFRVEDVGSVVKGAL
jgi:small-conductance mechanosensitive channel